MCYYPTPRIEIHFALAMYMALLATGRFSTVSLRRGMIETISYINSRMRICNGNTLLLDEIKDLVVFNLDVLYLAEILILVHLGNSTEAVLVNLC